MLARCVSDKKLVALKIVNKKQLAAIDPDFETIESETRILSMLSKHPSDYLVKMVCSFENDQNSFIGLEFCPGGELFSLIRKSKKLPLKLVRFYASCVLNALEHLHSLGIVYKDLKPENVVIAKSGVAKLTDFGLAVMNVNSKFKLRATTIHISAPEVLTHSFYSFASDWWSFGCLLYEMAVGRPAFNGLSNF